MELDNTTPLEIKAWLNLVKKIKPEYAMIYPIDRGTPAKNLQKISEEELNNIADNNPFMSSEEERKRVN